MKKNLFRIMTLGCVVCLMSVTFTGCKKDDKEHKEEPSSADVVTEIVIEQSQGLVSENPEDTLYFSPIVDREAYGMDLTFYQFVNLIKYDETAKHVDLSDVVNNKGLYKTDDFGYFLSSAKNIEVYNENTGEFSSFVLASDPHANYYLLFPFGFCSEKGTATLKNDKVQIGTVYTGISFENFANYTGLTEDEIFDLITNNTMFDNEAFRSSFSALMSVLNDWNYLVSDPSTYFDNGDMMLSKAYVDEFAVAYESSFDKEAVAVEDDYEQMGAVKFTTISTVHATDTELSQEELDALSKQGEVGSFGEYAVYDENGNYEWVKGYQIITYESESGEKATMLPGPEDDPFAFTFVTESGAVYEILESFGDDATNTICYWAVLKK